MSFLQSSQNFVRALKASSDPPKPGGFSKIDIVRQAWDATSFYVPNKGEVIVDWILNRLLKDRTRDSDFNPILDLRYWQVLSDILNPSEPTTSQRILLTKTWLRPLVTRIPVAPIVASLFNLSIGLDGARRADLYSVSSGPIAILWPLAVQKMPPDMLLDCFGALLRVLADASFGRLPHQGRSRIGQLITSSFRITLGNTSTKKKLAQSFTQSHLKSWIACYPRANDTTAREIYLSEVYDVGSDLLFNSDTLKQLSDSTLSSSSNLLVALRNLVESSASSVVHILPALLTSFTQATRKHKTFLFGSGSSSAVEACSAGMRFFAACERLLNEAGRENQESIWHARLGLLRVVENEGLFRAGQDIATGPLMGLVDLCVNRLDVSPQAATECLCVLSRIDHDLVDPFVEAIILKFLNTSQVSRDTFASSSSVPASDFLSLLLSYHIKTRTIPAHLSRLLSSFASPLPSDSHPREYYQHLMASPVFSEGHLEQLSRAVHTFITPGQTLSTAQDILVAFQTAWNAYQEAELAGAADLGIGARKKRRKSEQTLKVAKNFDAEASAISFVLVSRVVAVVLKSLPLQTVTDGVQDSIRVAIRDVFDSVIVDAISTALERTAVDGESKARNRDEEVWSTHVSGAAALRCGYIVQMTGNLRSSPMSWEPLEQKLVGVCVSQELLPELRVEIYRSLLGKTAITETFYSEILFDSILSFLETHLPKSKSSGTEWHGRSSELSFDEESYPFAATGLLRLVLDRYLAVFEVYSSTEQRARLIVLLFSINPRAEEISRTQNTLSSSIVVLECLRSAHFWEQANLRANFFTSLNSKISVFDDVDVSVFVPRASRQPQSQPVRSKLAASQITDAAVACEFLLYTPKESIPKSSRGEIIKRVITLDFVLGAQRIPDNISAIHALVAVRTFLYRIFTDLGSCDHQMLHEYLRHLTHWHPSGSSDVDSELFTITLDLVQIYFTTALRAAEKGDAEAIIEVIGDIRHLPLLALSPPGQPASVQADQLILRLMSTLLSNFSLATFPPQVISSLTSLFEHVVGELETSIIGVFSDTSESTVLQRVLCRTDIFQLWTQCIAFGRWSSSSVKLTSGLGMRLVQAMASSKEYSSASHSESILFQRAGITVFAVLLAELEDSTGNDREKQLGCIFAAYITLVRVFSQTYKVQLDEHLSKILRKLPVPDFSFALELVSGPLSKRDRPEHLGDIIHLSALMLHEAPDGTLKVVQTHLTQSLHNLVNNVASDIESPYIRLQVLAFVNGQCSDRPASVRALNMPSIWSLLSRYLSGCQTHDSETQVAIFHEIVSVVSALVRLRRDLVISTLPHLIIVLRQLMASLRSPRPHLGGKQYKLVTDTLPMWVHPAHPLGAEESKAFARLLSTLAVKTTVRVHGPAADSQKPESLARPLSKHIAYVIQAYVEALNDPLCVLPSDVRRELQPGLFILCHMLNEHARDALMASTLDAGGKAAMKGLWREYEKQRYVGSG
ncbi:hypothetical protein BV25DRAFT_1876669 [Artomyces pyxidatus]|uniref:Uncharacterized protein n=1 Tax=Artomyces pyxidatus TaxID=48021 RepID=A0ACB8THL9_9AGAM|nr:hypothetical protein BV25DRAFT_1876669 [Artomyces pyxidatus]